MSFLRSLFGKASFPPPKRTFKTLEQRKAELLNHNSDYGSSSGLNKKSKSSIYAFLPVVVILLAFIMISFNAKLQESGSDLKQVVLSPLYPEYSAVVDITANSEMIFRGLVTERGTSKKITVKDENMVSKKTVFTPVLLQVITPIKGEFEGLSVSYLELGGQTMSEIVEVSGVPPLAIDDDVFLFLQSNKTSYGKWSIYPVTNGKVTIESSRLPANVASAQTYTTLEADEFARVISELL